MAAAQITAGPTFDNTSNTLGARQFVAKFECWSNNRRFNDDRLCTEFSGCLTGEPWMWLQMVMKTKLRGCATYGEVKRLFLRSYDSPETVSDSIRRLQELHQRPHEDLDRYFVRCMEAVEAFVPVICVTRHRETFEIGRAHV